MNIVKRIFKKNIFAALSRKVRQNRMNKNIILIYTMGKVGSSTIYNSLKVKLPKAHLFHVHFLSDKWLKEILPGLNKDFHQNIVYGNEVLDFIKANPKKRVKIITLVREPLMRDISDIFQNWSRLFPAEETVDKDYLLDWIDKRSHEYTLNWFDTEFKSYLGYDVYSRPFDKEKGYSIYNTPRFDLLCIKLETLNNVYGEALKSFLNLDDVSLSSTNETKDKDRSDLYFEMLMSYKANPAKIEELYSSKYMKHFYTQKQIEGYKKKWARV